MLVLSRKKNQKIRLRLPDGSLAWLVVIELREDKVRLGLEFPEGVEILRDELVGKEPWDARREGVEPQGKAAESQRSEATAPAA